MFNILSINSLFLLLTSFFSLHTFCLLFFLLCSSSPSSSSSSFPLLLPLLLLLLPLLLLLLIPPPHSHPPPPPPPPPPAFSSLPPHSPFLGSPLLGSPLLPSSFISSLSSSPPHVQSVYEQAVRSSSDESGGMEEDSEPTRQRSRERSVMHAYKCREAPGFTTQTLSYQS